MRQTVVSLPSADDELMRIWLQATDKAAVRKAADRIEQLLLNPQQSLNLSLPGHHQLTVPPLTVEFDFSPDDCMVTIVWYVFTG
jgi:hypothetical protein